MWSSGDVVVWRNVWSGRIRHAFAMYVVEDSPERTVLFVPEGTRGVRPEPRGVEPEWALADNEVDEPGLWVSRSGDLHAARLWSYAWWYCNVEEGPVRTGIGFDARDLVLDVLVDERGAVSLKDGDELPLAVERGLLSADDAARAQREAERVAGLHAARGGAFGEGWERWRPPPAWTPAPLPDGWDEL